MRRQVWTGRWPRSVGAWLWLSVGLAGTGCVFDARGISSGSPADAASDLELSADGVAFDQGGDPAADRRSMHDTRSRLDAPFLCGPATCAGCCSAGQCKLGNAADACGARGGACDDCAAKELACEAESCRACTDSHQCLGEAVCVGSQGRCLPAYGRTYRVTVVRATIKSTDPYGDPWDFFLSPLSDPDPYVDIWQGGQKIGYTSTDQDTLHPVWDEWIATVLGKGDTLVFEVRDDDGLDTQLIGKVTLSPVPVGVLKEGAYSFPPPTPPATDSVQAFKVTFSPE